MGWQNGAAWLSNDSGWYKNAATAGGSMATYQSFVTESAASTTSNYGTVGIGTAAANRVVVVFIGSRGSATTVTAVTIGGNPATQVSGAFIGNGTASGDIWYLLVPAGTTAAITATWSVAQIATGIQVYSVNTSNAVPTSVNNAIIPGTLNVISTTITVPAGGVGLSGVFSQGGAAVSWTNATGDNHGVVTGGRGLDVASTTVPGSVTITGTVAGNTNMTMTSAAWGP